MFSLSTITIYHFGRWLFYTGRWLKPDWDRAKKVYVGGEKLRLRKWIWIGGLNGRGLCSSPPCRRSHSELTAVRTTTVCGPAKSVFVKSWPAHRPPGKWPLTCFELGVSCWCRALSCKKHTKKHLSRHCNGSNLEPELERRHFRCGLFGEQNRRLSSFIVASHKDSETMDAADLCDNKSAGSKKEECVCAHCVQSCLLWISMKQSLVYLH